MRALFRGWRTVIQGVLLAGVCLAGHAKAQSEADAYALIAFAERVESDRAAWLYAEDPCPADVAPEALGFTTDYAIYCADDPDRCLDGCRAGDANECYALARLMERADVDAGDVAQRLFLQSCRRGVAAGCARSATPLTPAGEDPSCARRSFAAACAADDPWGCAREARMLYLGSGGPQDIDAARAAAQKACALHPDFAACGDALRTLDEIERLATGEGEAP